jgi:glycosyltransferase involved in cell wall biosynthesis
VKKIRILHITQSSGGVQSYLYGIVGASKSDRFSHALIAPRQSPTFREAPAAFAERWPLALAREIRPIADFRAIVWLAWFLKAHPFDIVHIHSSKAGLIGRVAARLASVRRVIYSPHGFSYLMYEGVLRRLALGWERQCARLCPSILLAVSPSEAELARVEVGFPSSAIKMVFIGIQIDVSEPSDLPSAQESGLTGPVVLSVTRYLPVKNPLMVIRVAHHVRGKMPRVRFTIVSNDADNKMRAQAHNLIEQLNLRGTVQIIENWIARGEMARMIQGCTLYLSTSTAESFGYAVAEAMLAGKTVVGTDVPGTRDVVQNGVTGCLAALNDEQQAANFILQLLQDDGLRTQMGSAGRQRVMDCFDVNVRVRELENVYESLLNES